MPFAPELLLPLRLLSSSITSAAPPLLRFATYYFFLSEGCVLMFTQQVFQMQVRRVQILEESPLDVEPAAPPVVPASPAKRTPSKLFASLASPPLPPTDSSSPSSTPVKTTAPAKVSEPTKTSGPSAGPSKRRK